MERRLYILYTVITWTTLVATCPCPPGTFCSHWTAPPSCLTCPEGTYQPKINSTARSCIDCHLSCGPNENIVANCTREADLLCKCVSGYFKISHKHWPKSVITISGSTDKRANLSAHRVSVCKDCDIPIFPSAGSTAQNCRPCSVCPDGSTVGKICTETEDTLCVANVNSTALAKDVKVSMKTKLEGIRKQMDEVQTQLKSMPTAAKDYDIFSTIQRKQRLDDIQKKMDMLLADFNAVKGELEDYVKHSETEIDDLNKTLDSCTKSYNEILHLMRCLREGNKSSFLPSPCDGLPLSTWGPIQTTAGVGQNPQNKENDGDSSQAGQTSSTGMIVGFAVAACEVPIVAILVVVLMYRKRKFPCLSRSTIERGSSNEYESISVVNGDFYNARTRLSSGLPSEGGTLPRQRSMIDPNSSAMQSEIEFLSRHHSCPILMPLHASIQEMPFEPDQIPPGFDVETTPHSITAAVDNTRFDDTANTVLSQTSDNTSVRYIPGMEAQTAGAVNNREQGEEGDHILDDSDVKSELEDSSSVTNISGSDLGDVITRSSTASSFTDQQTNVANAPNLRPTAYTLRRAFIDLSYDLCSVQWEMLFRRMIGEGSDVILGRVKHDYERNIREQIYQTLLEWEKIMAREATLDVIVKELEDFGEKLWADKYRQKLGLVVYS